MSGVAKLPRPITVAASGRSPVTPVADQIGRQSACLMPVTNPGTVDELLDRVVDLVRAHLAAIPIRDELSRGCRPSSPATALRRASTAPPPPPR